MKSFEDMAAVIMLLRKKPRTVPEIAKLMGWAKHDHKRRLRRMMAAMIDEGLVVEGDPIQTTTASGRRHVFAKSFCWIEQP